MARLRKAVANRRTERPYTRKSKYQSKSYVRAIPTNKVVMFVMGDPKREFANTFMLISKERIQLRHNALESARLTVNRYLEKHLGKGSYFFRIRVYPHHILRENPLASGAGADRMSTGMKKSFGKSIGIAAQVKEGQEIFEVSVDKQNVEHARKALSRAAHKFPTKFSINEKNL